LITIGLDHRQATKCLDLYYDRGVGNCAQTGVLSMPMSKSVLLRGLLPLAVLGLTLLSPRSIAAPPAPALAPPPIAYGNNPRAGQFAQLNGIKLYYEFYRNTKVPNPPVVLIIHPNSGDIAIMAEQVKFFADRATVLVVDTRGHGKSEMGSGRLTYEQMAADYNALLEKLQLRSVQIVGWSDGGILGLLLAIKHPDKVSKLVVMGANLVPDGAEPWVLAWVKQRENRIDQQIASGDREPQLVKDQQLMNLMLTQPNIPVADLQKIKVPTLVMAGDRDMIRPEHTLAIFRNIPQAQLAIVPGATHAFSQEDPDRFNAMVQRFFEQPFEQPDSRNSLF
jgi:pimeloyl-ACP methyl ester carboxylesterase